MNSNHIPTTNAMNPERRFSNQSTTYRTNPFSRLSGPRPMPGQTEIYGAIIKSTVSNKYCLVQGSSTGKWSLPKGHRNTIPGDPPTVEDPFACASESLLFLEKETKKQVKSFMKDFGLDYYGRPIKNNKEA